MKSDNLILPEDFHREFTEGRIRLLEKDVAICLRSDGPTDSEKPRIAYFPGLFSCIATLNLMTCLHSGKYKTVGKHDVVSYVTKYMESSIYTQDTVETLWEMHRNKIAHMAHPEYVCVVRTSDEQRRITWSVHDKLLA